MKNNRKVVFAYIAVCIFWGSTYLAMRIGVSDSPPLIFASIRFLIAGSCMLFFCKIKGLATTKNIIDLKNISIVGLLLLLGSNGLIMIAEQWIHSSLVSILVAVVPINMVVMESVLQKKMVMDKKGVLGLLLGFTGVVLLVVGNLNRDGFEIRGILLVLLASIFWAAGSVYSKKFVTKASMAWNIGVQMLAGGIGLFFVASIRGELNELRFTPSSVFALAYLIIFGSLIGYSSYIYVLQHWPAAKAGTITYINPIIAVILGAIILNERITFVVLVSIVIIFMGVYLVQKARIKVNLDV